MNFGKRNWRFKKSKESMNVLIKELEEKLDIEFKEGIKR